MVFLIEGNKRAMRSLPFGRGSRVTIRGSRVNCRGSRVIYQYLSLSTTVEPGRIINVSLFQLTRAWNRLKNTWYHQMLKWYYDENRIFPIWAILKHKQLDCMRWKMLFTIFKYLFSFQRYMILKYANQPSDGFIHNQIQIWWKEMTHPICIRNVWFFAVRFY